MDGNAGSKEEIRPSNTKETTILATQAPYYQIWSQATDGATER